jgi:hypothetical protein
VAVPEFGDLLAADLLTDAVQRIRILVEVATEEHEELRIAVGAVVRPVRDLGVRENEGPGLSLSEGALPNPSNRHLSMILNPAANSRLPAPVSIPSPSRHSSSRGSRDWRRRTGGSPRGRES